MKKQVLAISLLFAAITAESQRLSDYVRERYVAGAHEGHILMDSVYIDTVCPYCRPKLRYADGAEVRSILLAGPQWYDLHADTVFANRRENPTAGRLVSFARTFLGRKYNSRDRATGINLDCSGYCMMLFRHLGYYIPRTASAQYAAFPHIGREELRRGDIVLFNNRRNGRIGHVGIVTEVSPDGRNFRFIHSSTSRGVIEEGFVGNSYYERRFVGFARIL